MMDFSSEIDIIDGYTNGSLKDIFLTKKFFYMPLRITGTGRALRLLNETENPSKDNLILLNRDFNEFTKPIVMQRLSSLPIIIEHPKDKELLSFDTLDDNKIIGNTIASFIRGSEIWGIAKIYDLSLLDKFDTYKSTSPAFVTKNIKRGNDDVESVIEINHLALVKNGFWDDVQERLPLEINNISFLKENILQTYALKDFNMDKETILKLVDEKDSDSEKETKQDTDNKDKDTETKQDSEETKEKETKSDNDKDKKQDSEKESDKKEDSESKEEKDKKEDCKKADSEKEKETKSDSASLTLKEIKDLVASELYKFKQQSQSIKPDYDLIDDSKPYCKLDDERNSILKRMRDLYDTTDQVVSSVNVPITSQRLTPEAYARMVLKSNKDFLDEKYHCFCDSNNISLPLLLEAVGNIENNVRLKNEEAKKSNKTKAGWESINANQSCDRNF